MASGLIAVKHMMFGACLLLMSSAMVGLAQSAASSAATPRRSVLDGVFLEQQAKRGQALYEQECASCHGAALQGIEMAPALVGPSFLANWGGLTLGDLFERIRQSMPPDDPTRLSRAQHADVVAYILKAGKYPSGPAELPAEVSALKEIQIRPLAP